MPSPLRCDDTRPLMLDAVSIFYTLLTKICGFCCSTYFLYNVMLLNRYRGGTSSSPFIMEKQKLEK